MAKHLASDSNLKPLFAPGVNLLCNALQGSAHLIKQLFGSSSVNSYIRSDAVHQQHNSKWYTGAGGFKKRTFVFNPDEVTINRKNKNVDT